MNYGPCLCYFLTIISSLRVRRGGKRGTKLVALYRSGGTQRERKGLWDRRLGYGGGFVCDSRERETNSAGGGGSAKGQVPSAKQMSRKKK